MCGQRRQRIEDFAHIFESANFRTAGTALQNQTYDGAIAEGHHYARARNDQFIQPHRHGVGKRIAHRAREDHFTLAGHRGA